MNTKHVFGILAVIIIASAALFWYRDRPEGIADPEPITAAFVAGDSGESVIVTFDRIADTAVMDGLGYQGLVFERAVSGSGARYENADEGLVLWNKGDELTIYAADDAVLFSGTEAAEDADMPGAPAALGGTAWTWTSTQMNDGTLVSPARPDAFTLSFGADGTVSGTTDCNSFFGEYAEGEGRTISFGAFGMTKMFCEGSQEAEFVRMVADSTSYLFTDAGELVLLIKYDSGSVMFERK